jgi:hypothetical protein
MDLNITAFLQTYMYSRRVGSKYLVGRPDHRDGGRCPVGPGDNRRDGKGLKTSVHPVKGTTEE